MSFVQIIHIASLVKVNSMEQYTPILYTTHCPMCKMLKQKLDALNMIYMECDDINIMAEKGITRVPMMQIEGELMGLREVLK